MNNISSNCLFHFTSKAEYLIGIFKNDFIPRYCFEEATLNQKLERGKLIGGIPMVCFCDISLGQISNHISTYGSYGIGMTKEWGIKNKLSPIIYVNEDSEVADAFANTVKHILNSDAQKEKNIVKISDSLFEITSHVKPYKGDFYRNGKLFKDVKFYNEREWRYIPTIKWGTEYKKTLTKQEYENSINLAKENSKLDSFKLRFTPQDIKYIFVKDENEIHSMVQALREIKGQKFSTEEIDILISKILTTKQINEDF